MVRQCYGCVDPASFRIENERPGKLNLDADPRPVVQDHGPLGNLRRPSGSVGGLHGSVGGEPGSVGGSFVDAQQQFHVAGLAIPEISETNGSNDKKYRRNRNDNGRVIQAASEVRQFGSQFDKPPIKFRLFLALASLFGCLCLSFLGWRALYNDRRWRGGLWLAGALLCGFGGLWLLLLSPAGWGWLI
jgi:hypothetical protein